MQTGTVGIFLGLFVLCLCHNVNGLFPGDGRFNQPPQVVVSIQGENTTTSTVTPTTTKPTIRTTTTKVNGSRFVVTPWVSVRSFNDTTDGNTTQTTTPKAATRNRIVGGTNIDIAAVPYQISVRSLGDHICGGAILTGEIAVTAAHCTIDSSPLDITLRVGSSTLDADPSAVIHQVIQIHNHPKYNPETTQNDISLLRVKYPFRFNSRVKAIMMASKYDLYPDDTWCAVCGWGYTKENGETSQMLQNVMVPLLSSSYCEDAYGRNTIKTSMVCAGILSGGFDACQGDSGGPMQCKGRLYAVVSWGEGCARSGFPGVYTKISFYRSWIDPIIIAAKAKGK